MVVKLSNKRVAYYIKVLRMVRELAVPYTYSTCGAGKKGYVFKRA